MLQKSNLILLLAATTILSCHKEPMPNHTGITKESADVSQKEAPNVLKSVSGVVVRIGLWDGTEDAGGCPGCKDNGPICYIEVTGEANGHSKGSYLPNPNNETWYVPNAVSTTRYISGEYTYYEISSPISSGNTYGTSWTQLLTELELD
jgi:hypothetical protein